jgi:hypothetical protein
MDWVDVGGMWLITQEQGVRDAVDFIEWSAGGVLTVEEFEGLLAACHIDYDQLPRYLRERLDAAVTLVDERPE